MPSIADSTRAHRSGERRRLFAGMAMVLLGALLVGVGAAGAVSGAAAKTGLVVGGVAVLTCLAALALRAPLRAHERDLVAVGVVLSLASVLFVWAITPSAVLARPALTAAGGIGYLGGVAVVLAAVLAGVTLDDPESSTGSSSTGVSWSRATGNGTQARAADGGTDDELSFSLDED